MAAKLGARLVGLAPLSAPAIDFQGQPINFNVKKTSK
jgi:hypothetical protein